MRPSLLGTVNAQDLDEPEVSSRLGRRNLTRKSGLVKIFLTCWLRWKILKIFPSVGKFIHLLCSVLLMHVMFTRLYNFWTYVIWALILYLENLTFGIILSWSGTVRMSILPVIGGSDRVVIEVIAMDPWIGRLWYKRFVEGSCQF